MIVKGAALKSRESPFLRAFLREFLRLMLTGREADVPRSKNDMNATFVRDDWISENLRRPRRFRTRPPRTPPRSPRRQGPQRGV